MSQAHCRSRAFSLAKLAYRPASWPEGYAVYAPLFLVQRPRVGRYKVVATGPPAGKGHPIELLRRLTPGLGWVLE